jgi:hypothetical protein
MQSLPRPDPRGPHRKIVQADRTAKANVYLLKCGHTSEGVTHFHLDAPGNDRRCFACGRIELAEWEAAQ